MLSLITDYGALKYIFIKLEFISYVKNFYSPNNINYMHGFY